MSEKDSNVLKYYLPKPAKPHTIMHIPESHTIYVGPSSCTRRHALRASKYDGRENVSFYFLSEADVISGSYDSCIVEAVGELLEILPKRPCIIFIAVFCIDDFLGTDEEALLDSLRAQYEGVQFAVQHIDPVSLTEKRNMAQKKLRTVYSFIEPAAEHDNGINFLGTFRSLPEDSEFLSLLRLWGVQPVRELFNCKTFQEYQEMGRSRLTVVFRQMSLESAQFMRDSLSIPYYLYEGGYDAEDIVKGYRDIAALLGKKCPDMEEEIRLAKQDGAETAALLCNIPIAVDTSASLTPFATAKALLNYGLNVRYIFRSNHKFKTDAKAQAYVLEHYPDIILMYAGDSANLYRDTEEINCIAIGADCARILRASHFVDVWHDEGYFGFQGVHKLLADIRAAYASHTDWSKVPELKIKGGKK